jgi:hypothetical protein
MSAYTGCMARFTRREIATLFAAGPIAAQQALFTAPPEQKPVGSASSLEKATHQVAESSRELQAMDIPVSVEPAFTFKV